MNRVQGDYFETLLYKIFVSIDEYTDMRELSSVLQIDQEQVKVRSCDPSLKAATVLNSPFYNLYTYSILTPGNLPTSQNAVSLFIRLGFAHKKTTSSDSTHQHPSWSKVPSPPVATPTATPLTLEADGSDSEGAVGQRSPSPGRPHLLF